MWWIVEDGEGWVTVTEGREGYRRKGATAVKRRCGTLRECMRRENGVGSELEDSGGIRAETWGAGRTNVGIYQWETRREHGGRPSGAGTSTDTVADTDKSSALRPALGKR